ncbi:hypothetical protein K9M59_01385 [Candidatus Gracilibacteria bacterium]|nr:hypothetical protein [Candidatus Gracilibacteria bacterium]MCF7819221.1 hypothetical protein [Candidatus Gracilibacteria bacterium]
MIGRLLILVMLVVGGMLTFSADIDTSQLWHKAQAYVLKTFGTDLEVQKELLLQKKEALEQKLSELREQIETKASEGMEKYQEIRENIDRTQEAVENTRQAIEDLEKAIKEGRLIWDTNPGCFGFVSQYQINKTAKIQILRRGLLDTNPRCFGFVSQKKQTNK